MATASTALPSRELVHKGESPRRHRNHDWIETDRYTVPTLDGEFEYLIATERCRMCGRIERSTHFRRA